MIITLIGFRGTGKSTLAPRLASKLGWEWADADVELEKQAGRTIREIFATDGEPEFRRLERETLVNLLTRNRLVLAAGGGAILNEATRRDFRAAGPVVWLQASVESIAARILTRGAMTPHRPSLTSLTGADEIRALVSQREPIYREVATVTVETDQHSFDDIVAEILDALPAEYRQEMRG